MAVPLWRLRSAIEGAVRRENYRGKEHIVVPVVALVEGVIQCANCPVPELALATEFGKFLGAWDGRPVTVPHPMKDGELTGAGSPEMLEQFQIGLTFNAKLEDKKLHMEAWIDPDLAAQVTHGPNLLERVQLLESGQEVQIEVSTGFFAIGFPTKGKFNGEPYQNIIRDIKPDHLALLLEDQVGACNWEDGCGVRPHFIAACSCQEKEDESDDGKLHQKFIARRGAQLLESLERAPSDLRAQSEGLSFQDITRGLTLALSDALAGDFLFIDAVFQNSVVYEVWSNLKYWERSWMQSGSDFVLGDEIVEVRPETKFVPVVSKQPSDNQSRGNEGDGMERKAVIDGLIANAATSWAESDRKFLEGTTDEVLEKLDKDAKAKTPEAAEVDEAAIGAAAIANMSIEQVQANAERLGIRVQSKDAPVLSDEDRIVLAEAHEERKNQKKTIIEKLAALTGAPFTKEELEAKSLEELRKLEKLVPAQTTSYERPLVTRENSAGRDKSLAPVKSLRDQLAKKAS
jgi:hypothetical protein